MFEGDDIYPFDIVRARQGDPVVNCLLEDHEYIGISKYAVTHPYVFCNHDTQRFLRYSASGRCETNVPGMALYMATPPA